VDFQEVRIALGLSHARMVPETELITADALQDRTTYCSKQSHDAAVNSLQKNRTYPLDAESQGYSRAGAGFDTRGRSQQFVESTVK
jgi:hypothetical protein